jgi:hypothetical protein
VNQDVEAVPARRETVEECLDLSVYADVERQTQITAELSSHALDTFGELVALVAECELRTFATHGVGYTECDRPIAREPDYYGSLAREETHLFLLRRE